MVIGTQAIGSHPLLSLAIMWDVFLMEMRFVLFASSLSLYSKVIQLVSWLPTDMAAAAVVELRHSTVAVLNVVHPNPVKWGTIMAELSETLHLPLVPYVEWFGCIEGISREQATLSAQKPIFGALKLLDMFRYGVKPHPGFESMGLLPEAVFTQSLQLSSTLKAAQKEQIGTRDIQKWVAKWQAVQFLLAV